MGLQLFAFMKKINREEKMAFLSTIITALLIHIYKFTNTLPNHDSVFNYYADQNVLGSGRWALSFACGFSSYYDLPWINGFLSCIFLALTAMVIVALFKINNPVMIAMTGALLAASPATTETLFFLFTADGYMIAMFLSALAVWWSRFEENRPSRWILSGLCICISCGIYQAYVSFALVLTVSYFLDALIEGSFSKKDCRNWILRQSIIYVCALAIYYGIWKLCLLLTGTAANNYQGIADVGSVSGALIFNGFFKSVKSFLLYFLQWDVLSHGFTLYSVLSMLFLAFFAIGLVIVWRKSDLRKRTWAVVLALLCLLAIVPFACIWHFTSDSVGYRAMMLQSITILFVLTAVLYEKWAGTVMKELLCVLMAVIIANNAVMANISYFYMHQCYERTYAEAVGMMEDIHDVQDEYKVEKIAFVGTRIYDVQYENIDPKTGKKQIPGNIHILSSLLEKSLLFDSEHTILFLQNNFGMELQEVPRQTRIELFRRPDIQAMACWPAKDSIKVEEDMLIIKLSNTSEE